MEIKLTQQDTKELTDFANEIPTKYGLPILNWVSKLQEKNKESERKSKK